MRFERVSSASRGAGPAATDSAIARIAAHQHGLVTRTQLVGAGLTDKAIQHRCDHGRLHRVHRGVYAVGYRAATAHARAMGAVLACGPEAVLSHRSAAVLWEMLAPSHGGLDVIAPGRHHHHAVTVHRSRAVGPGDATVRWGIPVTTPARTLVDLADAVGDRALARAVNEAQLLRLVRREDIAAALARAAGRRAVTRLRSFVELEDAPTRSVLEDAFLALVERHGMPRPEVNQRVGDFEVDMLWRGPRLIVELDGRAAHARSRSFEHDRERDAELIGAGFRVVRVTWRRLQERPDREAARLARLLRP